MTKLYIPISLRSIQSWTHVCILLVIYGISYKINKVCTVLISALIVYSWWKYQFFTCYWFRHHQIRISKWVSKYKNYCGCVSFVHKLAILLIHIDPLHIDDAELTTTLFERNKWLIVISLILVLFLLLLPGAVIGYIKVGRAIKYREKMIKEWKLYHNIHINNNNLAKTFCEQHY